MTLGSTHFGDKRIKSFSLPLSVFSQECYIFSMRTSWLGIGSSERIYRSDDHVGYRHENTHQCSGCRMMLKSRCLEKQLNFPKITMRRKILFVQSALSPLKYFRDFLNNSFYFMVHLNKSLFLRIYIPFQNCRKEFGYKLNIYQSSKHHIRE